MVDINLITVGKTDMGKREREGNAVGGLRLARLNVTPA